MGELRRGGNVAWAVGIALAALLALYVVAYYWMVVPLGFGFTVDVVYSLDGENVHTTVNRPATVIFAPINWLDRRIRPNVWRSPFDAWKP